MKIFISADIEGVTGCVDWSETDKKTPNEYNYFKDQMSKEVSAACEGAFESGADYILVKDAHDSARNINPSLLPKNTELIRGWSGHPLSMVDGITSDFDAAFFIGYHSYATSPGNPLSHSYNLSIKSVKINGILASEYLINAYAAMYVGVPVIFVSGDKALTDHCIEINPNIEALAVKEGLGGSVKSMHPEKSLELIKSGVKKALSKDLNLYKLEMPKEFKLEVDFKDHAKAYSRSFYPNAKLIDSTTISFETNDYFELLRAKSFIF